MSVSMDPASMTKRSDLNPPEKSKIPIKYKSIFSTSEQLLQTYYENVSTVMVSQNYDHFYFLALENGYEVKLVKIVIKFFDCKIT